MSDKYDQKLNSPFPLPLPSWHGRVVLEQDHFIVRLVALMANTLMVNNLLSW